MGKKEERNRVKKGTEGFVFSGAHLHDICCDLDKFMDANQISNFTMHIVGTTQVTYIEEEYGIKICVSVRGLEIR